MMNEKAQMHVPAKWNYTGLPEKTELTYFTDTPSKKGTDQKHSCNFWEDWN